MRTSCAVRNCTGGTCVIWRRSTYPKRICHGEQYENQILSALRCPATFSQIVRFVYQNNAVIERIHRRGAVLKLRRWTAWKARLRFIL